MSNCLLSSEDIPITRNNKSRKKYGIDNTSMTLALQQMRIAFEIKNVSVVDYLIIWDNLQEQAQVIMNTPQPKCLSPQKRLQTSNFKRN